MKQWKHGADIKSQNPVLLRSIHTMRFFTVLFAIWRKRKEWVLYSLGALISAVCADIYTTPSPSTTIYQPHEVHLHTFWEPHYIRQFNSHLHLFVMNSPVQNCMHKWHSDVQKWVSPVTLCINTTSSMLQFGPNISA